MVHKTPSVVELTEDRISSTQLNCILGTCGVSKAGVPHPKTICELENIRPRI
jgi:hypothetical protein